MSYDPYSPNLTTKISTLKYNNYKEYFIDQSSILNNKDTFLHNEKYFRPSKYPAINIIDFSDLIFNLQYDNPENVKLPDDITKQASEVVLNFFSILREANQGAGLSVGCGSVGDAVTPYPIAYAFLSKELQNQISYQEFLKLFENIYHTNLIAIVPQYNPDNTRNSYLFLVEFETLEGNSFKYYYSDMEVKKENSKYKINSLTFNQEDFFCAADHGWQHNAELKVAFMYRDWCKLVKMQYPTQQEGYIKRIFFDGTDGNQYMFVFFELTNGTDIAIGQYKKANADWIPVSIDPYQCLGQDT